MTELSHQASSRLVVSSLLPGLAIAVLAGGTAGSAFAADTLGELRERMVRVNIEAEGVRDAYQAQRSRLRAARRAA